MVKKIPKISVVMLNYNGLEHLKKTIPPIIKFTYPNYEFIIVDNGSTDGSIEFIKKFKKIRLIQSPRIGKKNFACNYAIKMTRGEYVLLLDNDALITDNRILERLIRRHNQYPKTGAIGLSFYDFNRNFSRGQGSYFCYYFTKCNNKVNINDLKKYDGVKIGFPCGIALFIRKKVWDSVGGYDEHLTFGGDDTDLGIKLWIKGYPVYLYSKSSVIHLGSKNYGNDALFSKKFKETFFSHLYIISKNYCLFNAILVLLGYSTFTFLRAVKQSIFRLSMLPFFAYFQGYYKFIKDLPYILRKRKEVQVNRVIKKDIFFKLKPDIDISGDILGQTLKKV